MTNALYLLAYLCAVIGTTLYLPLRTWWGGGTLRLLLDGAVINAAAFVILQYALPWLIRPWTPQMSARVTWLALDIGVIFIVGILSLRFGRRGGPLLALVFPSVLCLLIGDCLSLAVFALPGGAGWLFVAAPLYTLHRVLLALGAYRGVVQPPEAPPASSTAMPTAEWFLWTIVPRGMALAALLIGVSAPMPVGVSLLALVAVLIAREVLVVIDHRGATLALHLARETAQRTAIQTQDFLARIIHDIAAPTHGLRGATDRLGQMGRGQDACAADSVRMIGLHTQHMEHLVTQLRLYQQALAVAQPVLISIDLAPVCAVAVDAIQDRAESRGVTMRLVLEPGADRVCADTAVLRRVLDNLLSNVLVATPAGGEIVLSSAARDATATMIRVTDSGCGIPAEHQERIFAPLVRLQAGGMGLGLTIARELVSVMGGTLKGFHLTNGGEQDANFWYDPACQALINQKEDSMPTSPHL